MIDISGNILQLYRRMLGLYGTAFKITNQQNLLLKACAKSSTKATQQSQRSSEDISLEGCEQRVKSCNVFN